jgi:hypothetical protein
MIEKPIGAGRRQFEDTADLARTRHAAAADINERCAQQACDRAHSYKQRLSLCLQNQGVEPGW